MNRSLNRRPPRQRHVLVAPRYPRLLAVATLLFVGGVAPLGCDDESDVDMDQPAGTARGGWATTGSGGSGGSGGTAGTGGDGAGGGTSTGGTGGGTSTGGAGGGMSAAPIKLLDVVRTADAVGVRPGGAQAIPAMAGIGNGRLCWRVEVLDVPSSDVQGVQFCVWHLPGWFPEACSGGVDASGTGVYHHEEVIADFWLAGGTPVDWAGTGNVTQAMFKVGSCCGGPLTMAPGTACGAACYDGDLTPLVPRRARETAYMVPEGEACPDLDVLAAATTPLDLD